MARKQAAPKRTSKTKTAPEIAEMVKFEVTAAVVDLGQIEVSRGWKGDLPLKKAQTLVKLKMGKIIGV